MTGDRLQTSLRWKITGSNALAEAFTWEESERRRLVDRIHDDILQGLGTSLLKTDICSKLLQMEKSNELAEAFVSLRHSIDGAIESLRDLMVEIRPYDPDRRGILGALDDYAKHFESVNGVGVALQASTPRSLGFVLEVALYRIFQEALRVAGKQLGMKSMALRLHVQGGLVLLELENGNGSAPLGELIEEQAATWAAIEQSLQQLAGMVGGQLHLRSARSRDKLVFSFPLR